ncbi:MAG: TrkA family potassium uptake protein [Rikenellaceae bacterium]
MKYIVIGLGIYGRVLAKELTELGHEVIGVDSDALKVEMIKDDIATSFVLDATDESALSILPMRSVDVVIVAIGEAFGASIKCVALLKRAQAKHIYARALDSVHKSVLEAFSIDKILTPERDAARSLVQLLDLRAGVESLQLDKEYYILKFKVPLTLVGYKISDLSLEREFKLSIISLLCGVKGENSLGVSIYKKSVSESIDPNYKLCANDYLVCYGKYSNFTSFWRSI